MSRACSVTGSGRRVSNKPPRSGEGRSPGCPPSQIPTSSITSPAMMPATRTRGRVWRCPMTSCARLSARAGQRSRTRPFRHLLPGNARICGYRAPPLAMLSKPRFSSNRTDKELDRPEGHRRCPPICDEASLVGPVSRRRRWRPRLRCSPTRWWMRCENGVCELIGGSTCVPSDTRTDRRVRR